MDLPQPLGPMSTVILSGSMDPDASVRMYEPSRSRYERPSNVS